MDSKNYTIRIALYPFSCPVCGTRVRKGQNYVDQDQISTCLCVLLSRRLMFSGIRRLICKN